MHMVAVIAIMNLCYCRETVPAGFKVVLQDASYADQCVTYIKKQLGNFGCNRYGPCE